jgi:nucleotide-binding universal stress UspA family protein
MTIFKKILFPVDLSDVSSTLCPFVLEIQSRTGAELDIIFVARVMEHYAGLHVLGNVIKDFEKELKSKGKSALDDFLKKNIKNIKVNAEVVSGDPGEKIIQYSKEKNIDLIIMGTHGRKGIDRIRFGSVATKIVRNSFCPVMTINPYNKKIDESN